MQIDSEVEAEDLYGDEECKDEENDEIDEVESAVQLAKDRKWLDVFINQKMKRSQ